jgi:PatG C-terminal
MTVDHATDQTAFPASETPVQPDSDAMPPAAPPASSPAPRDAPLTPPSTYVYALGQIQPRFPSLAVEKEFAQVTGRSETQGLTDRQAMQSVLSDRANRYLARQLCWVFLIAGLETYILMPRDPADFELLVQAVRPEPTAADIDVVVGTRGPLAPPDLCNGLVLPIVAVDQLYSFDRDSLINAIPRPERVTQKADAQFRSTAGEMFDRIMQLADNAGATDEHRALNYLAVRYPAIYARTTEAYAENSSLTLVEVRPSNLSGPRNIVDVVFAYTHRQTDVTEKFFVRLDVTEEFPFLVTKLSPYYDH